MKTEVKDLNLNLRKLYFPFWCKTCLMFLAGFLNTAYSQISYNDDNKNYSTGSKVFAGVNLDINNVQDDQISLPRLAPSVFACSEATAVDYTSFTANWSASAGATGYFFGYFNQSFLSHLGTK